MNESMCMVLSVQLESVCFYFQVPPGLQIFSMDG